MIVIIAGPSGAGKTTVCKLLVKNDDKLLYSISATTRAKRKGEKERRKEGRKEGRPSIEWPQHSSSAKDVRHSIK